MRLVSTIMMIMILVIIRTSDKRNLAKATSNPLGKSGPHLIYNVSWAP